MRKTGLLLLVVGMIFSSFAVTAKTPGKSGMTNTTSKTVSTKTTSKATSTKMINTFEKPDFAYPQTVDENARKALDKAIVAGDWVTVCKAATQIMLARNIISMDSIGKTIKEIDGLAQKAPQPWRSMLLTLEANCYYNVYQSNRWTMNARSLPLDSFPENVKEWSRDLMGLKLMELSKSAVDEALYDVDIKVVESLLTPSLNQPKNSNIISYYLYFPTVGDFVSNTFCMYLEPLADREMQIPFGSGDDAVLTPSEKVGNYRLELYDQRLKVHYENQTWEAYVQTLLDKCEDMSEDEGAPRISKAFKEIGESPARIRLLIWLIKNVENDDEKWVLISEAKKLIEAYPTYSFTPELKNIINRYKNKSLVLRTKGQILSECPIEVTVENKNNEEAFVLLVKVADNCTTMGELLKGTVVEAQKITCDLEIPFTQKDTLTFSAQRPGRYCLIPSKNKTLGGTIDRDRPKSYVESFIISDIAIIGSSARGSENKYFVVSGYDQQPLSGAKIKAEQFGYARTKQTPLYPVTGEDGSFTLPQGNWQVTASYKRSSFTQNLYVNTNGDNTQRSWNTVDIFTDLALYKPGQTVNFVAVVSNSEKMKQTVQYPDSVTFILLDANRKEVDKVVVKAESDGRAVGSFVIPEGRLNGEWMVKAECLVGSGKASGSQRIRVEDYKLPSYYVEIDSIPAIQGIGKPLVISGIAKTYSGMPVQDADVRINIKTLRFWWRWYGGGNDSYSTTCKTDSKGRFTVELATERLKDTRFEDALMSAEAVVTDNAGETQTSPSKIFSFKTLAFISVSAPMVIEKGSDSKISVIGEEATGGRLYLKVNFVIKNFDGKKVAEGQFVTPDCPINPSQFEPGKYTVEFSAPEDADQPGFEKKSAEFSVFDKDSETIPYPTELWINPVDIQGDKAIVKFGGYSGSWMLVQTSDCFGIKNVEWVKVDSLMHKLTFHLPEKGNRLYVSIMATHNLVNKQEDLTIVNPADELRSKFETISFRDHLSPGDKERWTFRYLFGDKGVAANAVATMTDKALNAIVPFSWSAPGSRISWPRVAYLNGFGISDYYRAFNIFTPAYLREKHLITPSLYMYLKSVVSYNRVVNQTVMCTSAAADMAVEECAAPVMVGSTMKLAAASPASRGIGGEMMEEAAEDNVYSTTDAGGPSEGGLKEDVQLRPGLMPLAFFKPLLNADDDGNVDIEFEVPDFNTTWALQLVGYDADMHSAKMAVEAIASKRVMVKPNLPRFMRAGDCGTLKASLFNNSGEDAEISGRIEIINALTGKVIAEQKYAAEKVADASSRVIEIDFTAPADCEYLAVRCYATIEGNRKHTDAEQSMLLVLPASEPVVESEPFWLAPKQTELTINLPKFEKNDNVWLTYCDNPSWLCLTALPDITTAPNKDLFSKVSALYGRAIASGIAENMPQAREAIMQWFATNDSALISPLQKNPELKTLTLQRTPWIQNAETETLRMLQLDRLLNENDNQAAINKLVDEILAMQQSNGGFSWCPDFEPSVYATSAPLLYMGMLRQFGYEPQGLQKAVEKAISYIDKELLKIYSKKDYKPSALGMINWLYIRSFYPELKVPSNVAKYYNEGLRLIAKDWRVFGIYDAATAAIVLARNGQVAKSEAILESLKQKASYKPERGYWFDNLDSSWGAFNKLIATTQALEAFTEVCKVKGESGVSGNYGEMIDGLRQWLIIQRQAEDWGTNRQLAEVVNAVMRSGSDWTVNSGKSEIKLGNKTLNIKGEAFTGSVTLPLSVKDASGAKLTVRKSGDHPAWGGVVSRRYLKPQDVKAAFTPDVKIEKTLLKAQNDGGIETWVEANGTELRIGDKVRVLLTVTTNRDIEYVAITDSRAAFLEPDVQISGTAFSNGLFMYREVRDSSTQLFMTFVPKGVHQLTYDCHIDRSGTYSLGIATLQSQYAPEITAHSVGSLVVVK